MNLTTKEVLARIDKDRQRFAEMWAESDKQSTRQDWRHANGLRWCPTCQRPVRSLPRHNRRHHGLRPNGR